MKTTTKYILIGGGALVVTALVLRAMAKHNATQTASTPLSTAANALKSITSLSWGKATSSPSTATARSLDTGDSGSGGIPYGPGASDGYAAVSDATGTRAVSRAYVPAQTSYLTDAQQKLAGVYSATKLPALA